MKTVATSDWHLDVFTAGVDRYADVCRSIDASVEAAIEMGADYYLFGGDATDPNTSRAHRASSKLVRTFRTCVDHGITPLAVAGNHDVIEDGSGVTTLSALAASGMGRVFERPDVVRAPGLNIIALPFVEADGSYDPDEFVRGIGPLDGPVMVVGHLSLSGIHPGSETTETPRGRDVYWPLEALAECFPDAMLVGGHYHTPQVYNGVHIIGSLARLRFGENADELGYLVLEI